MSKASKLALSYVDSTDTAGIARNAPAILPAQSRYQKYWELRIVIVRPRIIVVGLPFHH
jgi:hypothetical protein